MSVEAVQLLFIDGSEGVHILFGFIRVDKVSLCLISFAPKGRRSLS
jgi:hypothetical protein